MTEDRVHYEKIVRVVTDAMLVMVAMTAEMTAHAHHVRTLARDLHAMTEHPVHHERVVRRVIKEMSDAKIVYVQYAQTLAYVQHEKLKRRARQENRVKRMISVMVIMAVMHEVPNPAIVSPYHVRHNATVKYAMACVRWWMGMWCVAKNVLRRANHSSPKSVTTAVKSSAILPRVCVCPNT
jgi:hypothetical protein